MEKNTIEFKMSLFHDKRRGYMVTILKPIVELLEASKTIIFEIKHGNIIIRSDNYE